MESLPQQLLIRVLSNWLDVSAFGTLEIAEISGGLSGALLWKITTPQGSFCLRQWPTRRFPSGGDLMRIHRFIEHTWTSGFRDIPLPRRTLQRESLIEFSGTRWELTTWLTGNSTSKPTVEQATAAVEALARFHVAGASFHELHGCTPGLKHRLEILEGLRDGTLGELKSAIDRVPKSEVRDIAQRTIATMELALPKAIDVVEREQKQVPVQWCHGDSHIGNFLFVGDQVTGILDFATAGVGSVARDLARLVGSMVPLLASPWQGCVEAYRRHRPLSADEVRLIFAFHISGTIGAAANWLRWRFVEGLPQTDAASTQARLVDLVARLELLEEVETALSAFQGPMG